MQPLDPEGYRRRRRELLDQVDHAEGVLAGFDRDPIPDLERGDVEDLRRMLLEVLADLDAGWERRN